ncbi:hypothetical protein [Thiolapillus sp.]|uniref:hypothetical protein n=1 Tax=Thiolapillus sp. TaxID=2017437 RepID=UPI003AF43F7B
MKRSRPCYLGTSPSVSCKRADSLALTIYKDQLVALKGLLARHPELPQALWERLLDRPALTASQCRDYFEAYAADPGRFIDPPPTDPAPAATIGRGLEGYGTVTAADREVGHDLH